jgi:hypothetical protein
MVPAGDGGKDGANASLADYAIDSVVEFAGLLETSKH